MATDAGWGRRLRAARRAYEERHDRSLSYREIGERVAALVKKKAAFAHPTVRAWFMEGQEPDSFAVATALASVLETDAGELITGQQKAAPHEAALDDITVGAVPLTAAQKARAVEKSDQKAAKIARSALPRKRRG